ncbi:MAG TPA: pyrrolo-quinoline quinone [Planctomycetaceae bacterium]|nr:pyrrolo-quinoline quinone [Planctomycetaceae bacterium]
MIRTPSSFKMARYQYIAVVAMFAAKVASAQSALEPNISYFRCDNGLQDDDRFALPVDLGKESVQLWRTELLPGHSSPCVSGDSIFVTTFDAQQNKLATVALERTTGQVRWTALAPVQSIEQVHPTGSPASPTPASNGRQVFVSFGSCGLLAYSWDGQLLWHHPLGPYQDEFGAASSPILVDDKVILNEDHDIGSFMIAMDQQTGQPIWKTERPEATRSYSTPIVLPRGDAKQIVIAGSRQMVAYDADTGEQLWWYDGLSRLVDSTPLIHGGLIYLATWSPGGDADARIAMESFSEACTSFDSDGNGLLTRGELPAGGAVLERFYRIDLNQDGSLDQDEWTKHAKVFEQSQNVAVALEPGSSGKLSDQYVRWTYTRGLPTVPSSVVYTGTMTMVKDSGIVTVLDVTTGQMLKQFRAAGRGNYYASLVAGDGKIYMASESGVVTVLKAGPEAELLGSHDFSERIMATPVIRQGVIYLRTEKAMYALAEPKSEE